jgi:hypothetical protein
VLEQLVRVGMYQALGRHLQLGLQGQVHQVQALACYHQQKLQQQWCWQVVRAQWCCPGPCCHRLPQVQVQELSPGGYCHQPVCLQQVRGQQQRPPWHQAAWVSPPCWRQAEVRVWVSAQEVGSAS